MSTGYYVRTNDKLLCTRGVLVENLLSCAVVEIVLVRRSCDTHDIILRNEVGLATSCKSSSLMFVESALINA